MLHPVLESLFLLKVARGYVAESIMNSDIDEKQELINYIQNEASDYEVMHLVTLGEMPEEKYDNVAEQAVWNIFKENVILNAETLKEDMFTEDIMTIIYEMNPVSELGYSSAAPILEFAKANGSLSNLSEDESGLGFGASGAYNSKWDAAKGNAKGKFIKSKQKAIAIAKQAKKQATKAGKNLKSDTGVGTLAAGAVGVAGIYGLYKLIKYWKAKRAAAKSPEAQKVAAAKLKAAESKLKAKKAKA